MNDVHGSNDEVDGQIERGAFYTIVWTRRLPLFVEGRGKPDSKMRHVALVMATYADGGTGARAYPSIATLMDETGYTEDEVKGALERIERVGVARVVGQVRGVDCWSFNLDADFSGADTVQSRAAAKRERDRERQQRHRDKKRHGASSVTARTEVEAVSQGFERDGHRVLGVTSQGFGRDVTLEIPGTFPVPARGELPETYPPSLAAAPPKEPVGVSTKLSRGGRAAVLAERDKRREDHTQSLAEINPDWDAEPSWSLFLAEFTARAEREGTDWTVQDWVVKEIKASIASTLLAYESRDKVDRALVKCAREAKAPWSEKAVKAFLGEEFHGQAMTVRERDEAVGTAFLDKPVEPVISIPVPRTEESGHEDLREPAPMVQAEAEGDVPEPTAPEVEQVEDDDLPLGYVQYDEGDDDGDDDEVAEFKPVDTTGMSKQGLEALERLQMLRAKMFGTRQKEAVA